MPDMSHRRVSLSTPCSGYRIFIRAFRVGRANARTPRDGPHREAPSIRRHFNRRNHERPNYFIMFPSFTS